MMPSAKHGDPQLGIDIHLCTLPVGPVPLPVPHMSVVFDPFDYIPFIGATIEVQGMKRATAGTGAITIHIPPGFPFAPMLPERDDELFMGSATVVADGDPFSYQALPVLGCQVVGMPSPPRPRKRKIPKPTLLPTTFNLAIPTNVFIGGAPTISMMGLAARGAFAGLGKLAKSKFAKKLGERFKKFRQKLFKNMDPGFLKCKVLRAEPVNILTGEVSVEQIDFTLPGRIPIEWVRSYRSNHRRPGACGVGWESPADARLEIDAADGSVMFHHVSEGPALFPELPKALGDAAAVLELMDGALLSDHGDEWRVRTKSDLIYHFPKQAGASADADDGGGVHEVPLGRISDLCGNWWDFERVNGRLSAIRESGGRHLLAEYTEGHIRSLSLFVPDTGFSHTFVVYEYDTTGNLTAARDEHDNPYHFAYDGHHMVRHTNRTGLSFHYEYDASGDHWQVVHAWGDGGLYDYHFVYWPSVHEVRITDSLGHASTVQTDPNGLPILEIDPLGGRTIFEYDEAGRTTAIVNAANHRTEYAYDERGNLLKLTRPDGSTVAIEADASNKPTAITDPNGAVWRQAWNERGLLVTQTSPLGAVTTYEYSDSGLPLSVTDALQARTQFSYDTDGYLVAVVDALGHVTRLQRDMLGNVLERTDPLGRTTRYRYDHKSRLIEATTPGGARIRCAYDAQDNLTHYEDENGARTRFEYFGQGLLSKRHQPDGHVVEYLYDTEEQLIGVRNQRGELYELKRDAMGRVLEEVDYWGQATTYEFDIAGHLKRSCDPLGRAIDFVTDKMGRIRRKSFEHPIDKSRRFDETFDFDVNGNLVGCANEHATVKRQFDAEGKLVEEKQNDFFIRNSFDALGRRIRRETSAGNIVAYQYDALGLSAAIRINDDQPITIERDASGLVLKETFAPALERHYKYDAEGRLAAQGVRHEADWLFHTQYGYDEAGNLLQRYDSRCGVDRYQYDPLGQIAEHVDPQGRIRKFFQDPAGNRFRTRTLEQPAQIVDGEEVNGEWCRRDRQDGVQYQFDRAGNLVERRDEMDVEERGPKVVTLVWDSSQRLVRSTSGGLHTDYGYDPLGRRLFKRTNAGCTWFGWDADALVVQSQNAALESSGTEWTGGHTPPPPRQTRLEYVYYSDTLIPLALLDGSKHYQYHNDPNGCPVRLTRSDGKIVWEARYDAYGRAKLLIEEIANPIRLQGQQHDDETGLHYNRYRYYDSVVGSFTSADPIGLAAGENTYRYGPNVLGWIDPLGLTCTPSRYEHYYRAMSRSDFEHFLSTGKLRATTETFISPTRKFSEAYEGVLVKFQLAEGTTQALRGIGVRAHGKKSEDLLPDLPQVKKRWTRSKALFKPEGDQINIGLGKGRALEIFNEGIRGFEILGVKL